MCVNTPPYEPKAQNMVLKYITMDKSPKKTEQPEKKPDEKQSEEKSSEDTTVSKIVYPSWRVCPRRRTGKRRKKRRHLDPTASCFLQRRQIM